MAMHRYILLALLALCGCVETDPVNREGVWNPTGANARNIAAMAASPQDLIRGRSDTRGNGLLAADAVTRLHQGKVRPLLSLGSEAAPGGASSAPSSPSPTQ